MLFKKLPIPQAASFGLEYTPDMLRLTGLHTQTQGLGYQFSHYWQQALSPITGGARPGLVQPQAIESLNGLRERMADKAANLVLGLSGEDLLVKHIYHPNLTSVHEMYSYCEKIARQTYKRALNRYSWDIRLLEDDDLPGSYALFAAYPLQKIAFLQDMMRLTGMRLQVMEPTYCALARACRFLLQESEALVLLDEGVTRTLLLCVQGQVFAVKKLASDAALNQQLQAWQHDKIIKLHIEKIEKIFVSHQHASDTDVKPDWQVQSDLPVVRADLLEHLPVAANCELYDLQQARGHLLVCAGLALRNYEL